MASKATLFTMGYSGHDLQSFAETLRKNRVETVIDVRQNPSSRKPGFSRTRLSSFLQKEGFDYSHVRELGVPTPLRNQLREGEIELSGYLHQFDEYLSGQEAVLDELAELATNSRCCLICVESESHECHRSVVATALSRVMKKHLEIEHI